MVNDMNRPVDYIIKKVGERNYHIMVYYSNGDITFLCKTLNRKLAESIAKSLREAIPKIEG